MNLAHGDRPFAAAVRGGFVRIEAAVRPLIMALTRRPPGAYLATAYGSSLLCILLFVVIVIRLTGIVDIQRERR